MDTLNCKAVRAEARTLELGDYLDIYSKDTSWRDLNPKRLAGNSLTMSIYTKNPYALSSAANCMRYSITVC